MTLSAIQREGRGRKGAGGGKGGERVGRGGGNKEWGEKRETEGEDAKERDISLTGLKFNAGWNTTVPMSRKRVRERKSLHAQKFERRMMLLKRSAQHVALLCDPSICYESR